MRPRKGADPQQILGMDAWKNYFLGWIDSLFLNPLGVAPPQTHLESRDPVQVEEEERMRPPAGQHLGLRRTRGGGLRGAGSSGLDAHGEMAHGSRSPEGWNPRERSPRDAVHTSRCSKRRTPDDQRFSLIRWWVRPVPPCLRSRTLPRHAGHVGGRWGAAGVPSGSAGVSRLRFFGAGIFRRRWAEDSRQGVKLLWGLCLL